MVLWVDDVRVPPESLIPKYIWVRTVNDAKQTIERLEVGKMNLLEYIDIDHDAGDYAKYGGDYIRLLDWLEETGRNYSVRIHSQNVVGRMNMRAIIQRNGWKEIK